MDPGHHGARGFGHFRNVFVLSPVVVARGRDEALGAFELLYLVEAPAFKFFLQRDGDRVAADRKSADEKFVALDKKEVGGTRSDIDDQ